MFRSSTATASAAAPASNSEAPSQEKDEPEISVEDQLLQEALEEGVQRVPKPSMKFLTDITYPDGSHVRQGERFVKIWKVRNEGPHAWPEGCVFSFLKGDRILLAGLPGDNTLYRQALPAVPAGEEYELFVEMIAPMTSGLYSADFQLQTANEQVFGQELFVTVFVTDEIAPVQEECDEFPVTYSTASAAAIPVLNADGTVTNSLSISREVSNHSAATNTSLHTNDSDVSVVKETSLETALTQSRMSTTASTPTETSIVTPAKEVDSLPQPVPDRPKKSPMTILWRKELEIIADMGFDSNPELLIPLLQKHLGTPVSLLGERNAVPKAEGMERVIEELFNAMA